MGDQRPPWLPVEYRSCGTGLIPSIIITPPIIIPNWDNPLTRYRKRRKDNKAKQHARRLKAIARESRKKNRTT